jgi:hypothetical protein
MNDMIILLLCTMYAQGSKTVYADPIRTLMLRSFVCLTGRTTMYRHCLQRVNAAALTTSKLLGSRHCHRATMGPL